MLAQRESYPIGFKDGYLTETSQKEHNGAPVQLKSQLIQLECQVFTQKKWISLSFLWTDFAGMVEEKTRKIYFHK